MLELLEHELVQVTEEIQNEVCQRIIDLIRHERSRRSIWNRLKQFFNRFKSCKCVCGASGIGCECEQKEPPQVIPPSVRVSRKESHSVVGAHTPEGQPSSVPTYRSSSKERRTPSEAQPTFI
jgi:hypothetical protein